MSHHLVWQWFPECWRSPRMVFQLVQSGCVSWSQCCAFQSLTRRRQLSHVAQHLRSGCSDLQIIARSAIRPSPRNCRLLVALLTGHDQPDPITFDETLKSLEQLGLWNLPSTWRSVQHHPWKHEEQLPSSFLVNFIITSCDLFQRNSQCIPEHANQKFSVLTA